MQIINNTINNKHISQERNTNIYQNKHTKLNALKLQICMRSPLIDIIIIFYLLSFIINDLLYSILAFLLLCDCTLWGNAPLYILYYTKHYCKAI